MDSRDDTASPARHIVAIGGAGFSTQPDNLLLERFILSLARTSPPRVCFVPTASGDSEGYVMRFYRAFGQLDCRPADLPLFERTVDDMEEFVLEQDVVYVGGGSTANLLAVWRTHGLDRVLERAWREGVVLSGVSAGMNCWFSASVTDSFSSSHLSALHDGVGLIPASSCPHYDSEEHRRPTYRRLVQSGELPPGWAAEDGVALVFEGTELREVVCSRPDAAGYRVQPGPAGDVEEVALPGRFLDG